MGGGSTEEASRLCRRWLVGIHVPWKLIGGYSGSTGGDGWGPSSTGAGKWVLAGGGVKKDYFPYVRDKIIVFGGRG